MSDKYTVTCPNCGEEMGRVIIEDIPHIAGHIEYHCKNESCIVGTLVMKLPRLGQR